MIFLGIGLLILIVVLCINDCVFEYQAPRLEPASQADTATFISVIIPARNEASRIAACLEGLASQHDISFEVIVIDDHSSDNTAQIAAGFADRLPALHVLRGAALPQGWAGKCWACWQGATHAKNAWLLFLDADVVAQPGLLAALRVQADAQKADTITLMPLLHMGTLAECLLLPAFQTILYAVYPLIAVSNPHSAVAFANGQAIFIHRAVYDAVDGHRGVRDSVLEDTDLGQRIKAAGYRLLAATAHDLLHVRMYDNMRSATEGLTKNAIAGFRSGGWRSGWAGMRQFVIAFGPFYLLAAALVLGWQQITTSVAMFALGLLALATVFAVYGWLFARRYRISPLWALGYPLGLAWYYAIAALGLARVWSGRGVRWKGRTLHGR